MNIWRKITKKMAAKDGTAGGGLPNRPNSSQTHILRIMRDIREFYKEESKDMFIVPEDSDVTTVHALIIGPAKTPYENGFFYFLLRFPSDYPLRPPSVKLVTTGGRTVRFNPNLYSDGKVCLSILGTWQGPAWSAAQTLFSTLLSIQTLMNEKPYHNEPGFEEGKSGLRLGRNVDTKTAVDNYNEMITHETIRVAVLQMVDDNSIDAKNMPLALKNIMISNFKTRYEFYEQLVQTKVTLDGQAITDPFGDPQRPKTFQYKLLLEKLSKLKNKFCDNQTAGADNENGAAVAAHKDPLKEPYNNIANNIMSAIAESVPLHRNEANIDNWDDLIDEMNEELHEDSLDPYVSESDDDIHME